MQGITVCPHCNTRFRISTEQLEAHHGMVRCGHCMQAFDTRHNLSPIQLDLQLDLPVLETPDSEEHGTSGLHNMTLAQQVAVAHTSAGALEPLPRSWPWADDKEPSPPKYRTWSWVVADGILLLALLLQATYFFRADLAAQIPDAKPLVTGFCQIFKCSVSLPRHYDLIGIESSELQTDPIHEEQIILTALLHNRANYAQAFPDLELTLNDSLDKPLARRLFIPSDYLSNREVEAGGLPPNREFNIQLHLNTGDMKPSGYRLVLLYSVQ